VADKDLETLANEAGRAVPSLVKAKDAVENLGVQSRVSARNIIDMAGSLGSTTRAAQAVPAYYAQISSSARLAESTFRSMTVSYGDFVALNKSGQTALSASAQSHAAIGQAAQFSAGELGKLGGALAGVFLSIATGEVVMEALIEGVSSIVEVVATAAIGAGGLQAALASLTAQAMPFLATFGPWIAGLAAVGAAVFFLNKRHEEHKKRIDDLNRSIGDMGAKLAQAYPSLNALTNQTDLASQGSANFSAWLRRKSQGMADYAKNVRAATLDLLNQQVVEAKSNADKLRAENIGTNARGVKRYIGPGDGPFGLFGGVNSNAYKKYVADQAKADQVLAHAQAVFGEAAKAPDKAFVAQAESAQRATAAVKAHTEAIQASAVEMVSLADGLLNYCAALAEEVATMGRSEEGKRRDAAARMISLAATQEEADEIRRLEQARRDQNRVMKEGEEVQKTVKAQQGETIKTINDTVGSTIRLSSKIEILTSDFENAVKQAADMRGAMEGIGAAIKNNDWTGAFANLFKVLDRVKKAFRENASSSEKLAAISGLGQGIGSMIGGKAGASISGAANGMQAGAQLASTLGVAGPWGAAIGAALGGLSGLFGSSAQKAQEKVEGLRKGIENLRTANMASSNSIAGALEEANRNWNGDLEYSSEMLVALRSIDNQIGALASGISQSIAAGKLMSTAGLAIGKMGGGGLFGSSSNTELLDQGLTFNPTTYGALGDGGLTGSTYADLVTTKTKKFLGVTTGVKVSTSSVSGAIDGDLLSQVAGVIQKLGDGVLAAATVFGEEAGDAAQQALETAQIDIGKLSLKGLSSEEIEKLLNATFSKVGDDLAKAGVPGLEKLADVGEGAFETLTRLAREYKVVDTSLSSIGMTFKTVGLQSLAARDALVEAAGGLDAFTAQTAFFGEHFLSEEERLKPVKDAVKDRLTELKLPTDMTREGFKEKVLGLDVSTEAGAKLYAALMDLAPAFDKVATAAEAAADKRLDVQGRIDKLTLSSEELTTRSRAAERAAYVAADASLGPLLDSLYQLEDAAAAATAEQDAAGKAYNDSIARSMRKSEEREAREKVATDARNEMANAFAGASDRIGEVLKQTVQALTDFADSLKAELGLGTTGGSLEFARRAFTTAVATGDYDAIPELGRAYADAAKNGAGSQADYLQVVAEIRRASLNSVTSARSDAYQRQLSMARSWALFNDDQESADRIEETMRAGLPPLPPLATGGSFTIGGNPGVDQNVMSINGEPVARVALGERVVVHPRGASNDNSETSALRAEIAALRADLNGAMAKLVDNTASTARTLKNVTPNGNAFATEAAS
jgi:hypothetical protein